MSLGIILPTGIVAVYGIGSNDPLPSGIVIPENYRQGTIYNIWDGGATYVYGGDVIYWKDGSEVCRIATTDGPIYTLVPARLATVDNFIDV